MVLMGRRAVADGRKPYPELTAWLEFPNLILGLVLPPLAPDPLAPGLIMIAGPGHRLASVKKKKMDPASTPQESLPNVTAPGEWLAARAGVGRMRRSCSAPGPPDLNLGKE